MFSLTKKESIPTTMELVKQVARNRNVSVIDKDYIHKQRLVEFREREVQGEIDYVKPMPLYIKEKLQNNGFNIFVDFNFINKFKYYANVKGYAWCYKGGDVLSNQIKYIGDIPDSILEKAEKAQYCGITKFTVHSMQPFPTIELKRCDPVLIGWYDGIYIFKKGIFNKRTEARAVMTTHGNNLQGVIIGVWDNEKEVEILS